MIKINISGRVYLLKNTNHLVVTNFLTNNGRVVVNVQFEEGLSAEVPYIDFHELFEYIGEL